MPTRLFSTALAGGLALIALGSFAGPARGDGLPVLGVDVGSEGVAAPSAQARYVTLPSQGSTIVARTAVHGGRILGFRQLDGNYTIPAVAYDGSASGLSADGNRLALIQPRIKFPRARTKLAILDAKRFTLEKLITLRGDYSFDAISPHGRTLFLVQYISPADPTRYHVRAYDLLAGRLLAKPVVDPTEHEDAMRGSPITRASSSDGRWAYTLYDGGGSTPFVHTLDTAKRTAHCIDLPLLGGRKDLWQLHLAVTPDDRTINVVDGGRVIARVETTTFQVSEPAAQATRRSTETAATRGWLLFDAAATAAILIGMLSVARRRRPRALASASH